MAGTGSGTNYFNTFLDVMNRGSASSQSSAAGPTVGGNASGLDKVMHALLTRNGVADVKDLLPETEFSLDALIDTLGKLETFDLIKRVEGRVELTSSGRAVAERQIPA